MAYEKITFVCKELTQHDSYYEDDNGHEHHTLEGNTKIVFYTIDWSEATKFYNEYYERNAYNPPYDTYKISLAYDEDTKEEINLLSFK